MKKLRRFTLGLMGVLFASALASCAEGEVETSKSEAPTPNPTPSVDPTPTPTPTEGSTTVAPTKKMIEVSFNSDGGSNVEGVMVLEGNKLNKPTDPTKVGHTFKGWFINDVAYDFNTLITEEITLKAKWEINKCKYSFYDLDGNAIKEEVINYGEAFTAPKMKDINVPDKYTLKFKGWDKEIPSKITEDVKFTPVYEKIVNDYVYSVSFNEGKIIISGDAAEKFKGHTIEVSWEFPGAEKQPLKSAVISDDLKFSIEFNVADFDLNKQGFAHVTITDTNGVASFGGKTTNLAINKIENKLANAIIDGTAIEHQINHTVDNKTYFLGNAWDGLMLYATDNAKFYGNNEVSLVKENDKIYYVVKGSYLGYTKESLEFGYNMQHNDQIDHAGWGNEINDTKCDVVVNEEGNEFSVKMEATALHDKYLQARKDKWAFTVHFGLMGNFKDIKNVKVSDDKFVINGVMYSLQYNDQSFNTPALILKDVNSPAYESASIENVDGKAIITITGKCGVKAEFFKNLIAEENSVFNEDKWDGSWAKHNLETTINVLDKTFTLKIDVTELEALGYKVQIHTELDEAKDVAISEAIDTKIVIGSKEYRLFSKPGSGDPKEFWGNLAIIVTNVA